MRFVLTFFLLVVFFSSAELLLLLKFSAALGFLPTFALCALTGIAGGALVRRQGLRTVGEIRRSLEGGAIPAEEIVSGFMLILIGVLLILPGFLTDTAGLLLLIPPLRRAVARRLLERIRRRMVAGPSATGFHTTFGSAAVFTSTARFSSGDGSEPAPRRNAIPGDVIDVEFTSANDSGGDPV